MAILLATLLTFVGLMLIFQLIYFEISRKRALRVNNLVWFEQFNRPLTIQEQQAWLYYVLSVI